MQVTLDDRKHELSATAEYSYTNNSPDTLHTLFLHLYPNAYDNDRTAFTEQMIENGKTAFYYSKEAQKGRFRSLDFGNPGTLRYLDDDSLKNKDQGELTLQTPLLPGETRTFSAQFRVKIPSVFSRFGHTGQAYFITQWFPKFAVYDREGWHVMPYLDQGEFYDEIGSYDVEITLPQNYVVMATGNCQTESENRFLDSLSRVPLSAYLRPKNAKDTFPPSSAGMKTVRFTEDNIHDFAWFADKRFIVRKDSMQVAGNGFLTTTWTAFLPADSEYWEDGNAYLKAALKTYSANLGPYPYRTVKAVEGDMKAGGGMEYPTITVIDRTASPALKTVVIHEVGHNWFQGILASNERRDAWMDEGLNSFYEWKAVSEYNKTRRDSIAKAKGKPVSKNSLREESAETIFYYQLAKTGDDQPLNLSSEQFRNANYGGDVYYKTAAWMRWLEAYMGEDNLRKAMQDYYAAWKFRHPQPEDFFAALRRHSPKSLDWFINNAFSTTRPVNFSLRKDGNSGDSVQLSVKNNLPFAAPALVQGYMGDSVAAQAWTAPFEGHTTVSLPRNNYSRILLSDAIPDATRANNSTRRGLKLGIPAGLQNDYKTKIWITPALGYNVYDGLQAGLLFHNTFAIPEARFRYALAPTWGFRSGSPTGAGSVGYFFFPQKGAFQSIGLQADFRSYHYNETALNRPDLLQARYTKIAPELSFTFRNRDPRSPVVRSTSLRAYGIREEGFVYNRPAGDTLFYPSIAFKDYGYLRLRYEHRNERAVNPFSYAVEAHGNGDFVKLMAEGNLRIDYGKNGGLYLRGFAGKIFLPANTSLPNRYALQATSTGVNDYLYDGSYFGRSEREGFSSHQIGIREGGLKIPTPFVAFGLSSSDNWLASVNISTTVPFLPVRLFFDAATFSDIGKMLPSGSSLLYDGGVSLHFPYDVLNVYLPFVMSEDYRNYLQMNTPSKKSSLNQTFVFQLNLHNVNWLRFTGKALKKLI